MNALQDAPLIGATAFTGVLAGVAGLVVLSLGLGTLYRGARRPVGSTTVPVTRR